ncbi:type II secretion system F family protein [Isoptericola jiangsuensis]|uniref:type II secretion system F family protein n=1 Tax=Isoptericola jiangsuensis TaxID=548579 RepID=UPI003AAD761F
MTALVIALVGVLVVFLASAGLRLLTSTGLEDVEEAYATTESTDGQAKGFVALLDRLGSLFLGTALRAYGSVRLQRLDRTIRRAGRPDGVTVTMYVRRQTGFLVLALLFLVVFAAAGNAFIGVLVAGMLALWMPFWLRSAGERRQRQIESDLPDFLDVLGVTVSAGLSFRQAIERVCEFHDSALSQEMRTTMHEMSVGLSRREAFVGLRERVGSESVASFVTALLQAEELGVPLADALTAIAADVRREHAQVTRQRAAKAAPKISLVVTMTILPGALLLIVAAMIMGNREALGGLL